MVKRNRVICLDEDLFEHFTEVNVSELVNRLLREHFTGAKFHKMSDEQLDVEIKVQEHEKAIKELRHGS